MTGHDPLCACKLREHNCESHWAGSRCTRCECWKIARVRDDNMQALAHAREVAARLVEVICEMDAELDRCDGCRATLRLCLDWHGKTGGKCCPDCEHPAEAAGFVMLRAERDAARAEVATLREELAHAWAVANGESRR